MARFIKKFCIAGLGVLVFCLSACDDKKEPMKPAPPKVVSKTIEFPKKTAKKTPEPKPQKTAAKAVASASTGTGMSATTAEAAPQTTGSSSQSPDDSKNQTAKEPGANAPQVAGIGTAGTADKPKAYARKGRLDPFLPLLSEKKEPELAATPVKTAPKRMLTPLEKMELSQIKLVAVIEMSGRSIAMVEEASGKGYEVNIGTYIGRNGGRVSAITADGIVVKEIVQDFKGNRRERFQEIKFNKNEGN